MGWKVAGSLVPAGNRAGCKVVSATDFVASGSLICSSLRSMGWKVAGSLVPAGNRAGCKVVSATDFVASGSLEFPKGDFA